MATRGQTDMRGLVTAGRLFGWSVSLSKDERGHAEAGLLIVVSRVAPRAATPAVTARLFVVVSRP
jgi:hypothetical protein